MRVKALGLNHVLADDAESRRISMPLYMRIRIARRVRGSREEPDGTVREDAIHIEKDNFDFPGAIERVSHWHLVLGSQQNLQSQIPNTKYQKLPLHHLRSPQIMQMNNSFHLAVRAGHNQGCDFLLLHDVQGS